jgi:uncharacterized membrane protein
MRLVEAAADPGGTAGQSFLRFLRQSLGFVLVVVSCLATAVFAFVTLVTVADLTGAESSNWVAMAVSGIAAIAAFGAGVRLFRGRRRLVLFLRRFGFTGATRALSEAVADSLGHDWRLITLDDAEVASIGVHRRSRRAVRIGWLAVLAVVGLGLWMFVSINSSSTSGGLGGIVAFVLVVLLLVCVGVVVLVASLFLAVGTRALRRAERSKALAITRPEEVERSARRVKRQATRFFAPRLIVARVTSPLWREVVERLLQVADVVIVDVSELSPNMLWELGVLSEHRRPWVAVGQVERLRAADGRLALAVGDRDVLTYQEQRLAGFGPALRRSLEEACAGAS